MTIPTERVRELRDECDDRMDSVDTNYCDPRSIDEINSHQFWYGMRECLDELLTRRDAARTQGSGE